MRVFVWEYLTSGAWPDDNMPDSLLREGSAMLRAIVEDFAAIPDCHVFTMWDERLGDCPLPGCDVFFASSPEDESRKFADLCSHADAVMIIAPEFDNLLQQRCQQVAKIERVVSLNCDPRGIPLAADKFAFAHFLDSNSIRTLPTRLLKPGDKVTAFHQAVVVKPRLGAGSQATHIVQTQTHLSQLQQEMKRFPDWEWIVQPYVRGQSLSMSAIVNKGNVEIFPLGLQLLSTDGRLKYQGGRIPFESPLEDLARKRVQRVIESLPGLQGYLGFDLLIPHDKPDEILIVELNPRLTTSYRGYRHLTDCNLAERMLPSFQSDEPIVWNPGMVEFSDEGE